MTTSTGQYLLDNAASQAADRFTALSEVFDAFTLDQLTRTGIGTGWRCWEVGAGGPSVPTWLASAVGPTGKVIATDINTAWLDGAAEDGGFDVVRHDVADDEAPGSDFDLVHARLVLTHVLGRDRALGHMIDALRPGGVLVLEDFDPALLPHACIGPLTDAEHRANAIRHGFMRLLEQRGVDMRYGRKLPRLLRRAGLVDVSARAAFPVGGPAAAALELSNVVQLAEALIGIGATTRPQLEEHVATLRRGELDITTPPLISVTGRKPSVA